MKTTIDVIERYHNQYMQLGGIDCLSMLLEVLGCADLLQLTRNRYKTIIGAKRVLPRLTEFTSMDEFIKTKCTTVDNHNFIQDGDILIVNSQHTYIYIGGEIFGTKHNGIFGYQPFNPPRENQNFVIYRKK